MLYVPMVGALPRTVSEFGVPRVAHRRRRQKGSISSALRSLRLAQEAELADDGWAAFDDDAAAARQKAHSAAAAPAADPNAGILDLLDWK